MDKIRVFIAGFQGLYRAGVRYSLMQDEKYSVAGEACGTADALTAMGDNPPDMVIIDADTANPPGIEIAWQITRNFPGVSVILISDVHSPEKTLAAIRSGAKAYLASITDQFELLSVIEQIVDHKLPISLSLLEPAVAARVLDEFNTLKSRSGDYQSLITLLEIEETILNNIRDGLPAKDISERLDISAEQFTGYLENIVTKSVRMEGLTHTPAFIPVTPGKNTDEPADNTQSAPPDTGVSDSGPDASHWQPPEPADTVTGEEAKQTGIESTVYEKTVESISEVIRLAIETGRLSVIQEVNQSIESSMESLIDEIDKRRRMLRRVNKAIEDELEISRNIESTWDRSDKGKTEDT
jgi:DNA-binding NarL/FixJ family response regulator